MKHVELSVVDRKIQHDVRAIQHDLMIRLLGSAWCFSNAVSTDTWIFDEQNMGLWAAKRGIQVRNLCWCSFDMFDFFPSPKYQDQQNYQKFQAKQDWHSPKHRITFHHFPSLSITFHHFPIFNRMKALSPPLRRRWRRRCASVFRTFLSRSLWRWMWLDISDL